MSKSIQPTSTLRRVRRAALTTVGALLIVTATPLLGSGADFTGQATVMGNAVSTATLTAPTGPALTAAGVTGLSLGWEAAPVGPGAAADYTVQRSLSADGSNPATVYSGADLATTDAGGLPGVLKGKVLSSLSSGNAHSCVIADGAAYCWGSNGNGQLGDGTTQSRDVPTLVGGEALAGQTVTALSAGIDHTCAIASGAAYCWGNNDYGQLGDNTTTSSRSPVVVTGALAATLPTQINAGYSNSCAIAADQAYCWGDNSSGELGDGTRTGNRKTSALVGGILATAPVTAIRPGRFQTCAIAGDAALCWGNNSEGFLGVSTSEMYVLTPSAVVGLPDAQPVTSISSSNGTQCAVAGAIVLCWGRNGNGQLGSESAPGGSVTPIALAGALTGLDATAVTVGEIHACAIADGKPYCWGTNVFSELGDGGSVTQRSPVAAVTNGALSGEIITEVSAGRWHSCALSDGAGYCWGRNDSGELGNGAAGAASPTPTSVSTKAFSEWVCPTGAILTGDTCSLTPATTYYYQLSYTVGEWTAPSSGWLPVATTAPAAAGSPSRGAASTSTALSVDWPDASWGAGIDPSYTLQRSLSADGSDPTTVYTGADLTKTDAGGLSGDIRGQTVTSVSAGFSHTCALAGGSAYCWGENDYGQLGDGTTITKPTPTAVGGLLDGKTVTTISAGEYYTCATAEGQAYCWGTNDHGQLGDNTTTNHLTPERVEGELASKSNVTSISASQSSTCAVADARAYCWGANWWGQLGIGTTDQQLVPIALVGDLIGKTVTSITAGNTHTCAIADGSVYCSGSNWYRQLGTGTDDEMELTPLPVIGLPAGTTRVDSANGFSCAVAAGAVYCWGGNGNGQVGDGTTAWRATPTAVGGLLVGQTATDVSVDSYHACAAASGVAYCWGLNGSSQLGDGTTTSSYLPREVVRTGVLADQNVAVVDAAVNGTCAIAAGSVYCWGNNASGQLGDGSTTNSEVPVPTDPTIFQSWSCPAGAVSTGAGADVTCSLTPGTTYYYQLSYTAAGFTPAPSGFTGMKTSE